MANSELHLNKLRMAWELAKVTLSQVWYSSWNQKVSTAATGPLKYAAASFLAQCPDIRALPVKKGAPVKPDSYAKLRADLKLALAGGEFYGQSQSVSGKTWTIDASGKGDYTTLYDFVMKNKDDPKCRIQSGDCVLFKKGSYDNRVPNQDGDYVTLGIYLPTELPPGLAPPKVVIKGAQDTGGLDFAYVSLDAVLGKIHPVVFEAEAGVTFNFVKPCKEQGAIQNLSKPCKDEANDPGAALIFSAFDGAGSATTSPVPLVLRNLHFSGRMLDPQTQFVDEQSSRRAHAMVMVSGCASLIVDNCQFLRFCDVGGTVQGGLGFGLNVANIHNGLVYRSIFDGMTNIDTQPADWREDPNKPENVEALKVQGCSNLKLEQCYFGNSTHFNVEVTGSSAIKLERCFFRNRLHSCVNFDPWTSDSVIERCVFAGSGARTHPQKGIPNSYMIAMGGKNNIVAFNVFMGDPEATSTGYIGDSAIYIATAPPSPCLPGYVRRCVGVELLRWDANFVDPKKPPLTKAQEEGLLAQLKEPKPKWNCPPTQPQACGVAGGLSNFLAACDHESQPGNERKGVCSSLQEPQCIAPLRRVCLLDDANTALGTSAWDKSIAGLVLPTKKTRVQLPGPGPLGRSQFSEESANEGHVILNNLILDVGASAVLLGDSGTTADLLHAAPAPGTSESAVRNVLVLNNVILGQRRDPSQELLNAFVDKQPPASSISLPYSKGLTGLDFDPGWQGPGLVSVNLPGQYEGFAGNEFWFNAIGRRDSDPLILQKPSKATAWSTGVGRPCTDGVSCGVTELLHDWVAAKGNTSDQTPKLWNKKSENVQPGSERIADIVGKIVLPRWAAWNPVAGEVVTAPIIVSRNVPFTTDFAVRLPGVFKYRQNGYLWAAVSDLNTGDFGYGNTTARGLDAAGSTAALGKWLSVLSGLPLLAKAWPTPAALPQLQVKPDPKPKMPWYPTQNMPPPPKPLANPLVAIAASMFAEKWPHAALYAAGAKDFLGNPMQQFADFLGPWKL